MGYMTLDTPLEKSVCPLGLYGLVVRFGLKASEQMTVAVRAFIAELEAKPIEGVTQVSGALASVLVEFDDIGQRETIRALLEGRLHSRDWLQSPKPTPLRRWTIPVAFGGSHGPHLAQSAAEAGMSEIEAIESLCGSEVEVLCFGFAPGQAYAGFLPDAWDLPRLPELAHGVPSGALILAIKQLIIFTNTNSTGWRHIGQTGFLAFDQRRTDPYLLRAGDALAFEQVSSTEMDAILEDNSDGRGQARLEVLR